MGKMSHRRISRSERDHMGCMWGFINMFDFRGVDTIADYFRIRDLGTEFFVVSAGFSENVIRAVKESDHQLDNDDGESIQPMLGDGKISVKKLMEEDMVDEDRRKHNSSIEEKQDSESEGRGSQRRHKRSNTGYQQKRRFFYGSVDMESEDHANAIHNADINDVMREIIDQIQQKSFGEAEHEGKDYFCALAEKKHIKFEKQLIEATMVFLYEKMISDKHHGEVGKIHHSRELADALKTLILHKELILELLEDPNSESSNRVNSLLNAVKDRSSNKKECAGQHYRKHHLFSRRRGRSILDPASTAMLEIGGVPSCSSSLKTKSPFSFSEIKRRLKHAMGKDTDEVFKNEKLKKTSRGHQALRAGGDSVGRPSSPSKNPHLEAEIHPKCLSSPRRSDNRNMEILEINLEHESKKHSSEKLTEDMNENYSGRQDVEVVGKILSIPDCLCSPTVSLTRNSSCRSPIAEMRLSASQKTLIPDENSHESELENDETTSVDMTSQNWVVESLKSDDKSSTDVKSMDLSLGITKDHTVDNDVDESICSVEMTPEGDVEDLPVSEVPTQLLNTYVPKERTFVTVEENGDTAELAEAITIAECDKLDTSEEDCVAPSQVDSASSSSSSHRDKAEEFEDNINKTDRPSPVSVLESMYLEDEISAPSSKMFRGELPVPPLRIQFDENEVSESERSTRDNNDRDNNKSKQTYMKEILTAADFSWDKFYLKSLSSEQLLDSSLSDAEVDILSDQPSDDYKLLFDCLNEVLNDSCARYFGGSPCASISKPNIRPIPDTENAFREIWEGVEWHLRPLPPPRSLEQMVAKDLAKDMRWMNLRFDVDTIGSEIEELIFEDLVGDTAQSYYTEYMDDEFIAVSTESIAE